MHADWEPYIFGRFGVNLNAVGMRKYVRSIRGRLSLLLNSGNHAVSSLVNSAIRVVPNFPQFKFPQR
jgi:hypothetical protein